MKVHNKYNFCSTFLKSGLKIETNNKTNNKPIVIKWQP
jgi:hypothetical protein